MTAFIYNGVYGSRDWHEDAVRLLQLHTLGICDGFELQNVFGGEKKLASKMASYRHKTFSNRKHFMTTKNY